MPLGVDISAFGMLADHGAGIGLEDAAAVGDGEEGRRGHADVRGREAHLEHELDVLASDEITDEDPQLAGHGRHIDDRRQPPQLEGGVVLTSTTTSRATVSSSSPSSLVMASTIWSGWPIEADEVEVQASASAMAVRGSSSKSAPTANVLVVAPDALQGRANAARAGASVRPTLARPSVSRRHRFRPSWEGGPSPGRRQRAVIVPEYGRAARYSVTDIAGDRRLELQAQPTRGVVKDPGARDPIGDAVWPRECLVQGSHAGRCR
jgi:hypothetical protein